MPMNETIIQKAQELAGAISKSEEALRWEQAQDALLSDEEAQELMANYRELTESSYPRKELILKAKEDCLNNDTCAEYWNAKDAYDNLITTAESVLNFLLGGESEGKAGGCAGNCSGCSGCQSY